MASHRKVFAHCTSFFLAPHLHCLTAIWRQEGQEPLWQRSRQVWLSHPRVLPQVSPQVGVASVQARRTEDLPQGQERSRERGQGGQGPAGWQIRSQEWKPQARSAPQGWPHLNCGAEHGRGSRVFRHSQLWTEVRSQGGHSPGWQVEVQEWAPHPSSPPHSSPQDHGAAEHRRVTGLACPQWQVCCTVWGQGGQGPGWQRRLHRWEHPGRATPHRAPQLCGVCQGSKGGSRSLAQ